MIYNSFKYKNKLICFAFLCFFGIIIYLFSVKEYRIALNVQYFTDGESCLNNTLFLTSPKTTQKIERGNYVAATMPKHDLGIGANEGIRIIKIVMAVPGDSIRIDGTELYINGVHQMSDRLWLAKSIPGKTVGDFDASYVLKDDEYFLMGTNKVSFDSRYWGPIKGEKIYAFATPIF